MSKRAIAYACCALVAPGCNAADVTSNGPQPVSVAVGFWGSVLEVGVASRVCAFGTTAAGLAVATQHVEAWRLSDPTLAKLQPPADPYDRLACTLLLPVRPGVLTVTAQMAGVAGAGTVRLIPTIQTVRISPSSLILRVADSASLAATFIAANGDTIRDLPIIWRVSDNGAVSNARLYDGGSQDSVLVNARAEGQNTVTAEAATPRQDSASNTKGRAQVVVTAGN